MRHHAEHVAALVDDAGDGIDGAIVVPVRIDHAVGRGIAEDHPALAFQPRDGLAVGDVVALAVRDRHADHLAGIVAAGEGRVGTLDPQINVMADEAQVLVAHQHAGQQPGLAQNLEAVANAEREPPVGREFAYRVHDWAARGDRPATKIVAVGEAPRDHHQVAACGKLFLGVPDHGRLNAGNEPNRARHVALAIDAGENEDGGFHSVNACSSYPLPLVGEGGPSIACDARTG